MLLLATGLVDELPQIENFRQFYGSTVHNCPYCDGWECRGQPIAVTGCNQESLDLAIELLLWSKDLVLCTNGALTVDHKAVETIKRLGIRIIETPIALLEGAGDTLEGVRFTDGSFLPRSALFFSPGQYQRSHLAEQLGCEFCEDSNCIQCGENAATNIPGVYAAGNASRGVQLVIAAAAEGMQAAFAINSALLDADAASNALRDHEPGQPTSPEKKHAGASRIAVV
jgi:thioredoxin reductase